MFINVSTLNILRSHKHDKDGRRLEAFRAGLKETNPDVLLLQEISDNVYSEKVLQTCQNNNLKHQKTNVQQYVVNNENIKQGVAVLTKNPHLASGSITLDAEKDQLGNPALATWAVFVVHNKRTLAVSAHLGWGGAYEYARYQQMVQLTGEVNKLEAEHLPDVTILGADFNAEPNADSRRFLRGETNTKSGQYWVQAGGNDQPYTLVPQENILASEHAAGLGIKAENLPPRSVDGIYVKGWVHGRVGNPKNLRLSWWKPSAGIEPSDHWGVTATLDYSGKTEKEMWAHDTT